MESRTSHFEDRISRDYTPCTCIQARMSTATRGGNHSVNDLRKGVEK